MKRPTWKEFREEYKKAENANQRFFILAYGVTAEKAKQMDENLRDAMERAFHDRNPEG